MNGNVRDRIKNFRRVPAQALRPNPRNWRTHGERQRAAMQAVLEQIGYADALLARELPDGSLELIDGHLRAETTPDSRVPVLVLDVTTEEADLLLATLDPLAGMAGTNLEALTNLLDEIHVDDPAIQSLLAHVAASSPLEAPAGAAEVPDTSASLPELYQVVVECSDEAAQRDLYERLTGEGWKCKVLTM